MAGSAGQVQTGRDGRRMLEDSDHPLDRDDDPVADSGRIRAAIERIASADDLSLVASVLEDLADASEALHARRDIAKATFFGSARIDQGHGAYTLAHQLAARLSADGYDIVTGGGPGVMTAALEGALPGRALGVGIELPFEQRGALGPPVVYLERFLTRKLAMVRHVRAFVCAAGGIGTLDEFFEVLVLLQTGKKRPAPIVLLQEPGSTRWEDLDGWIAEHVVGGLARESDRCLYRVCHSVDEAYGEITGFYSRYRGVGPDPADASRWALETATAVGADELAALNEEFADLAPGGFTVRPSASGSTLSFAYDLRGWGRLRQLIDAVNRCL